MASLGSDKPNVLYGHSSPQHGYLGGVCVQWQGLHPHDTMGYSDTALKSLKTCPVACNISW